MRYHVLVLDYDGTLAKDNQVPAHIIEMLLEVKATGRKLVLVTGRELNSLQSVFPEYIMFDRIVAENGALLYNPATMDLNLLAEKPPRELIDLLKGKNVPISLGHIIVATWQPHQNEALEAIRDSGIEYQLIFNKGAVMILPPGVNKASGLQRALEELNISIHNTVVVGDAENDYAMLTIAEFSAAVQNALPRVKEVVDWVAKQSCGEGVAELIAQLVKDDLFELSKKIHRHGLILGTENDGTDFKIGPYATRMLLVGRSSCGKTTTAVGLVEKLIHQGYQFCLIDPEGDYRDFTSVVSIGDATQVPLIGEVIQLLKDPRENLSICLLGLPFADRPGYFRELLAQIAFLQQNLGHPHFLILDEAHHLVPKGLSLEVFNILEDSPSFLAVTTNSRLLHPSLVKKINVAMMMGDSSKEEWNSFAEINNLKIAALADVKNCNAIVWRKNHPELRYVKASIPTQLLKRHKRKYATGDMGYNSFYFRGPGGMLNLKAQNLYMFIQMGEGVDDDTWLFHLRRHDYSNWFRNTVRNAELASDAENIERKENRAKQSRQAIFDLIKGQYAAPA